MYPRDTLRTIIKGQLLLFLSNYAEHDAPNEGWWGMDTLFPDEDVNLKLNEAADYLVDLFERQK